MSEVMEVDDAIAALKSPSIAAADEFFDAVDDGKLLFIYLYYYVHRCLFAKLMFMFVVHCY